MTNKEYRDTMIGTSIYAFFGVLSGYLGWMTVMVILGSLAVFRALPVLLAPFNKEDNEQDKG